MQVDLLACRCEANGLVKAKGTDYVRKLGRRQLPVYPTSDSGIVMNVKRWDKSVLRSRICFYVLL